MQPPLLPPPPPPPACDMPQSSNTEQTVTHELTFGTSNLSSCDILKVPDRPRRALSIETDTISPSLPISPLDRRKSSLRLIMTIDARNLNSVKLRSVSISDTNSIIYTTLSPLDITVQTLGRYLEASENKLRNSLTHTLALHFYFRKE